MNLEKDGKYQSIFSKKENKKKSGRFYTESLVEVTQIIQKKIKLDTEDKKEESKNSEIFETVDVEVCDTKSLERIGAFSVTQKLLQWIFIKDFTNPLWISINNKHLVKNVVFLIVSGAHAEIVEANISKENTPFFEKYLNSTSKCYMKNTPYFSPDNERFWELFFSSKFSNDSSVGQKKKARDNKKQKENEKNLSYEECLFQKYKLNVLESDELQSNLYPMENLPVYSDSIKTQNHKLSDDQRPIKNLILGLDCEMVRTSQGLELARMTIINFFNEVIYDEHVKPENPVEDYLTKFSGITEETLMNVTKGLKEAQQDLLRFCDSETILVGHSLENDLHSLQIIHNNIIDTAVLYQNSKGFKSSLKNLAHTFLHIEIQKGSHDSSEDAKAALALAKMKIEILDTFEGYYEKKKSAPLDILENIFSAQKTILPLDEDPYINPLLKYAISYDEVKSRSFEEITTKMLKWLRMKATGIKPPSIMTGVIKTDFKETAESQENEIKEEQKAFFNKLDKRCKELADLADKNTVFMIVFCDSKEKTQPKKEMESEGSSSKEAKPPVFKQNFVKTQSLGLFFVP